MGFKDQCYCDPHPVNLEYRTGKIMLVIFHQGIERLTLLG